MSEHLSPRRRKIGITPTDFLEGQNNVTLSLGSQLYLADSDKTGLTVRLTPADAERKMLWKYADQNNAAGFAVLAPRERDLHNPAYQPTCICEDRKVGWAHVKQCRRWAIYKSIHEDLQTNRDTLRDLLVKAGMFPDEAFPDYALLTEIPTDFVEFVHNVITQDLEVSGNIIKSITSRMKAIIDAEAKEQVPRENMLYVRYKNAGGWPIPGREDETSVWPTQFEMLKRAREFRSYVIRHKQG